LISIWICLGFDTQATQPKDFYMDLFCFLFGTENKTNSVKSRLRALKSKLIFFPKNSVSGLYQGDIHVIKK